MKWYHVVIIVLVLLAGTYTGGYFHGKSTCPQEPGVIDETPTDTGHVKPPKGKSVTSDTSVPNIKNKDDLCRWFENCYKADISIEGSFDKKKPQWFNVYASDPCKYAKKSFKLEVPTVFKANDIGFGISGLIVYDNILKKVYVMPGGIAEYTRYWKTPVGEIGFGPAIHIYGAFDRSMFAGAADLIVRYRW